MTVDQKYLAESSHFSPNPCGYSFGIIAELQSAIIKAKEMGRSVRVEILGVSILVYPQSDVNSLLRFWEEQHEKRNLKGD